MRVLVALLCCALSGCTLVNDPGAHQGGRLDAGGQRDAGADGGPARLETGDFCQAYAELQCNALFDCCPAAEGMREARFAMCITAVLDDCVNGADATGPILNALVSDRRTGYDPVLGAETIAEGNALAADCSIEFLRWTIERDGLQRGLTGTLEGGSDCEPNPAVGFRPDYAALFSCLPETDGTYRACALRSGVWNCVARGGAGDPCVTYFDCQSGFYCTSVVGTCQPRKPNDMACTNGIECESLFCDELGQCATPGQADVYCPRME